METNKAFFYSTVSAYLLGKTQCHVLLSYVAEHIWYKFQLTA